MSTVVLTGNRELECPAPMHFVRFFGSRVMHCVFFLAREGAAWALCVANVDISAPPGATWAFSWVEVQQFAVMSAVALEEDCAGYCY